MRHGLESLLLALAIGATVVIAAKRAGLPYNVVLVVTGLLAVLLDVLPSAPLNPDLVMLVFLPMLVFEGALFADADHLRSAARPIVALSLPGVALSLLATGVIATTVLSMPFAVALLMGALLAITDTVSVLLAFRGMHVPHKLAAVMEGESLFNDGTALVLVSLCTGVVATGVFDPTATARSLLIAIVGGGVVGAAIGTLGASVLRSAPDHLTAVLSSVVLVFASSLMAERVHASPIIAVVVAGLLIGRTAKLRLDASRTLALRAFWEMSGFVINVILFLLVGMQIKAELLFREAVPIALALVALHAGRAIAVYGSFAALRAVYRERVPATWQHVMVAGNIKGALSMAAVLALPLELPWRERLITIVFGVTFVTLVTQGLPFKQLLRWLKVTLEPESEAQGRATITLIAAKRGQAELDKLFEAGLVSRAEHAQGRAELQREVIGAEHLLRGADHVRARKRVIDTSLLTGKKAALIDAAQRGLIDTELASEAIADIDSKLLTITEDEGSP